MSAKLTTSFGSIIYSDDFLTKLSCLKAMECYGIVGMASVSAVDGIVSLLKIENLKKGVKIKSDDTDSISVDLFVIVKYGVAIPAVANSIIDTVKYGIEQSTGLNVLNVNVVVQGIQL